MEWIDRWHFGCDVGLIRHMDALEVRCRFWQQKKTKKSLIIESLSVESMYFKRTTAGFTKEHVWTTLSWKEKSILTCTREKKGEVLTLIKLSMERTVTTTLLRYFCIKKQGGAEPAGTRSVRFFAVKRLPHRVCCKQQSSPQEANLKHEVPDIFLWRETWLHTVGYWLTECVSWWMKCCRWGLRSAESLCDFQECILKRMSCPEARPLELREHGSFRK